MLANLLKNALKYSPSLPVYIIAAYDELQQKLIVQVADCGLGLDEKKLRMIRQVFEASSKSMSNLSFEEDGDDCNNLSMCKRIVDLNGGNIEVHSKGI